VHYVVSKNLQRRHLTISQRATIAAEMVPMLAKEAKERQEKTQFPHRSGPHGPDQKTKDLAPKRRSAEVVAEALGVGPTSVKRALRAKKKHPEDFEKAKRGETTVTAASEGRAPTRKKGGGRKKGTRGIRINKTAPYEIKTKGQRVKANSQKKKMVSGLSTLSGNCRGLSELDIPMVFAVCDAKEVKAWAKSARELARQLVSFARKLEQAGVKK